MTIGQRIKERRLALGMTVDELAKKLGKNRATVYRYESDEIKDMPLSVLVPLAKALYTTPGYLMGLSPEDEQSQSGYYYDPETAALAQELYDNKELGLLMSASRKMSPEALRNLTALVESMIKDEKDNGRS